jgi:hypothetical protein
MNDPQREAAQAVQMLRIDARRRGWILFAFWSVVSIEIGLGIASYLWPDRTYFPIGAMVLAVAAFAAIDFFARPEIRSYQRGMLERWYRPYLKLWCLVPFLTALAGSVWTHYEKLLEARAEIIDLAKDIKIAVEAEAPGRDWDKRTTEEINASIHTMVDKRFGPDNKTSGEAKRFAEIARVVGRDLRRANGDPEVQDQFSHDTLPSFALAMGVQGLFVMWIPALLAVAIARATKRSKKIAGVEVQFVVDQRDHKIIAEDEYYFIPRMCFAILLVLGTNYVFSPFGLKATYIISIVDEHAMPGHTTLTLWTTAFAEAPVMVVGFVGFLLYALITATQRFVQDDFDDQALLSLLVRGLVVILLSLALSSSELNDTVSRLFVFIAGVFPVRALEAIAKKVNIAIDPDFGDDPTPSFAGLPSLDSVKVFALRAAGIQSTYDLAATDIDDVAERVRIDPRLLGRAVDRAILIDAMGLALVQKLDLFSISSATQLVRAMSPATVAFPPADPVIAAIPVAADPAQAIPPLVLMDAARRTAERLSTDKRVAKVEKWLATWSEA